MSDMQVDPKEEGKDPKPVTPDTPAGESNTDTPGPVPYSRFKEVNDQAKRLAQQIADLQKKQEERDEKDEQARKKALKDQEQYKELADELDKKVNDLEPRLKAEKERADQLEAQLKAYADSQLESVPEVYRDLLASLPVVDQVEWLNKNRDKLGKERPNGVPPTPEGQGTPKVTDDERRRRTARTF